MLACVEHPLREGRVGWDWCRECDRIKRRIGQQLVQIAGEARAREHRRHASAGFLGAVTAIGKLALRKRGEVAREVWSPVPKPDDADRDDRLRHRRAV